MERELRQSFNYGRPFFFLLQRLRVTFALRGESIRGGWKPVISSVIIRVETFNGGILLIATFFSPSLIYFIFFFLFFLESRIITTRI